jgi:hypothetical protein
LPRHSNHLDRRIYLRMICKFHLRCILHKPFLKHLLVDVLPIQLKHQFLFLYSFLHWELQYQLLIQRLLKTGNSLFCATSFNSPNSFRNGCPVYFRMFSLHARSHTREFIYFYSFISFTNVLLVLQKHSRCLLVPQSHFANQFWLSVCA